MRMTTYLTIFRNIIMCIAQIFRLKPIHTNSIDKFLRFTCKPEETFKYDCQLCTCDELSRTEVICETRHCRKKELCIPMEKFKKVCSLCTCQLNGIPFCKSIQCTHRTEKRHHKHGKGKKYGNGKTRC